jgi:biotin carboxylase
MSTDLKGQTPQTEAAGAPAASTEKRLLLLASKLGYQTRSFAEAAKRVGAEVVLGTDRCHQIDDPWADGAIAVHFDDPESAAQSIIEKTHGTPITGVLALGDRPTETAAFVARALGLPYSSPEAVRNCRSKLAEREVLQAAGLPVPAFFSFALSEPIEQVLQRVEFPCVVKPLTLSASQGVVRANNAKEFTEAVALNRRLLNSPEIQVTREAGLDRLLVEHYIHGGEVAVEGLLSGGKLRVLAVFDKPDPLIPGAFSTLPSCFTVTSVPSGKTVSRCAATTRCGCADLPGRSPSTLPAGSIRTFCKPASRKRCANSSPRFVSIKEGAGISQT